MSFDPDLLTYVQTILPNQHQGQRGKIVFSDLVTDEFRRRKTGVEFPISLDSLESFLHHNGFLETDYAFLPNEASQKKMRAENNLLRTLGVRGQRSSLVKEAQLWGINMMNYLQTPAFFALLQLAGVPIMRNQRDAQSPLIVLGGHIWPNPLPLSSFYDVLVVGDGETILVEIVRLLEEFANDRTRLLAAIAQLEGVYVPCHTKRIVKRSVIDFQNPSYSAGSSYLYAGSGAVLLSRGCAYACAFCNNSLVGGNYRAKPISQIKSHIDRLAQAGARTIIPLAASSSAYQSDGQNFFDIVDYIHERGLSFKNLSDRPEKLTTSQLRMNTRLTGKLILAPETSPRIRWQVLQKSIQESTLERAIDIAIGSGSNRIQLYVILSIPAISPGVVDHLPNGFNGEQAEDLNYLASLAVSIVERMQLAGLDKADGKPYVFLDCMPFVPAIGTLLQRAAFMPYQEYKAQLSALQALIPVRYAGLIEVSAALDEYTHLLQVFLERATSLAGEALLHVWQKSMDGHLTVSDIQSAVLLAGNDPPSLAMEFLEKELPYKNLIEVKNEQTCGPNL